MPSKSFTDDELLDYLRTNVRRDGECMIWAGCVNERGYPILKHRYRQVLARRTLAKLSGLDIDRKLVWSTCDNIACMAPEHMRTGTRKQFWTHLERHGRVAATATRSLSNALSAAKRPGVRLSIANAADVYERIAAGESYRVIGDVYGVTRKAVQKCVTNWRRAGVDAFNARRIAA